MNAVYTKIKEVSKIKVIRTTDAVGHILCHDITRIIKDVVKDTIFRKGHIVTEEDIPVLLSLGKDHLYIWENDENSLHENEAAEILCGVCQNENMHPTDVAEGKIELIADCDGLFQVDIKRLDAINELDDIIISTRHTNTAVKKGDRLLGTRIIPLVIPKDKMDQVKKTAGGTPIVSLTPFKALRAGIITTGNEVYHKRIKDTFTPVVIDKLASYGIGISEQAVCDDNPKRITDTILRQKQNGADLILCAGGMSVDPDDKTPAAVKASGAQIITYGAPVLPGAMFLLAYFEDGTPVMGLPGCVMYAKATVFDLVLPRIAAGVKLTKRDFARMGNGGLCLGCSTCRYPCCGFGKGI